MCAKRVKEEEHEEELCGSKEENERQRQKLDSVFEKPRDVLGRAVRAGRWPKAGTLAIRSPATEAVTRDAECHLSGREGARAGVRGREVPTRCSRARRQPQLGLRYQSSREGPDSRPLWSCPRGRIFSS
ncbi:uncharacterized protein LOC133399389 isoform X2 [Phycodurus eques]|uniref:uncharacterized protein LOC133399389 isoform X2 n=1 Tax=Phycodurus eques TaxID=693459 RepID=UPI002ACE2E34|nr:uncharacterized protein LOC133399389 isoform X2 [Phycodurus eques]